jgi:xylose isomerase
MRSYLILKEKVQQFRADPEITALTNELQDGDRAYDGPAADAGFSSDHAAALRTHVFDADVMSQRGRQYEALDQLVMELLLGVS